MKNRENRKPTSHGLLEWKFWTPLLLLEKRCYLISLPRLGNRCLSVCSGVLGNMQWFVSSQFTKNKKITGSWDQSQSFRAKLAC